MAIIRKAIRTAAAWNADQTAMEALYGVGGYYTSVSAWITSITSTDLVTDDETHIAEGYDDWPSGLADTPSIPSKTTDATRNITLTVLASERGDGQTGAGFRLTTSSSYTFVLRSLSNYTLFEYVGIESSNVFNSGIDVTNATNCTIDSCLIDMNSYGNTNAIPKPDAYCQLSNNVVLNATNGIISESYNVHTIYNNIVSGCTTGFVMDEADVNGTIFRNNVAFNCTTDYDSGFYDSTSSHNASDEATGIPGTSPIASLTSADFNNVAGDDYSLVVGSDLIGAGADLSAIFTNDITGATRATPYDVGPFKYVAAVGGDPWDNTRLGIITPDAIYLGSTLISSFEFGAVASTSSITQYGITWTFDEPVPYGTFVNGDYWVVGPVTINSITPASITEVNIVNGSMINPNGTPQGYDGNLGDNPSLYSGALNVALDVSLGSPLVVPINSSLVSSISVPYETGRVPALQTAAVLTVLPSMPAVDSFRPPYSGTDKSIQYNKSDLNYSYFPDLAHVASTPDITTLVDDFKRLQLSQTISWLSYFINPADNMNFYGRDISTDALNSALALCSDYTEAQKEPLLINAVQAGIDNYHLILNEDFFKGDGGNMCGRKTFCLLAALCLDDSTMLSYLQTYNVEAFQEDNQVWEITSSDVGRVLDQDETRDTYIDSDVGIPEWGNKHLDYPATDGRQLEIDYRGINNRATMAAPLVMRLLVNVDGEALWSRQTTFDYFDRMWRVIKTGNSPANWAANQVTQYHQDMIDTYNPSKELVTGSGAGRIATPSTACSLVTDANALTTDWIYVEYMTSLTVTLTNSDVFIWQTQSRTTYCELAGDPVGGSTDAATTETPGTSQVIDVTGKLWFRCHYTTDNSPVATISIVET